MRRKRLETKMAAILAALILVGAGAACTNNSSLAVRSVPEHNTSMQNATDAKRLSDGANKLIVAMEKPTNSFHFSYKGEENVNDAFRRDKTQSPRIAEVALQADVSPEQISLTETRGPAKKVAVAKSGDETKWAMANLITLGALTDVNLVIAVGSTVASPPSIDLVGGTPADKFSFDTAAATPSQKMGLQAARMVQTATKDCKGTAWISKDSGLLIKFNIDADYLDKYNRAWKEHYEGEVTPK